MKTYYGNNNNKYYINGNNSAPVFFSSKEIINDSRYVKQTMSVKKSPLGWAAVQNNYVIFLGERANCVTDAGREKFMDAWKENLVSNIKSKPETKKIILFTQNHIDSLWIIVSNPSTKIIKSYTDLYVEAKSRNPEKIIDFMVFGESELDKITLPKEKLIIE